MKLLFDQNLSYRLVAKVNDIFRESAHVAALGLDKASDFNDLTTYHGFPPHIIWLRSGNSSVRKNAELLLGYAEKIKAMILSNETGIVEVLG